MLKPCPRIKATVERHLQTNVLEKTVQRNIPKTN